jgi:hypothetical protein
MPDDTQDRQNLIARIKDKRGQIAGYIATTEPRGNRLTTMSIVCGALAGLLTAGPAVGGPNFTKALTAALDTSPEANPSWRILCAAATILSVIATTAIAIYRNENLAVHVSKAQASGSRLEALETSLELGAITVPKATELYERYINEVSFIPRRNRTA